MPRNILAFVIVVYFAVTMCPSANPQQTANATAPPAEAKRSSGRKLKLEGVPNFGEVTDTLYRGAQPTKEGFHNLAKMNINIVVDLRGSRKNERKEVTRLGMEYVPIHWRTCLDPEDADFARFLTLLRENPGKKVFIHCRTGDDRTGMMIAAYRMAEQGWSAKEAKKEMEAHGFTFAHHLLCPGLSSYEERFPKEFETSPAFRNLRHAGHTQGPQF